MKVKIILALFAAIGLSSARAQLITPDHEMIKGTGLTIQPVNHATLVLSYQHKNIYVDPVGGAEAFKGLATPDMIMITDIHGDHFDPKTLDAINTNHAVLLVPQAVADKMPPTTDRSKLVIVKNGETVKQIGISITAMPMYNLPESPKAFHIKGRGNGYLLNIGGKNIYISGDTADIPEMRSLKNIDIAFVCMNLPYTMDVVTAAKAVLAFKPKVVYPYHYRGQDVNQFKSLVNAGDKDIEVRLRNWYPTAK
ncbi:MBL fold metallo-hydrolase [Mucilaginibacter sp. UR6-11]|uniref:MBL fold metallo-hydrolase n=1 Tax=Mucilaginibacter sp. UR6-11 TaxID=1435644 RepID=UPI001E33B08F|nr:MBL fold metallo-hydrolase [Mucilaginibacter sp. UR6-11]MCC8425937.1 MBL fold metallo-hydrolase [Mucilaginibacter sp. UR6-11]